MFGSKCRIYRIIPCARFVFRLLLLFLVAPCFGQAIAGPLGATEHFFAQIAVGAEDNFNARTIFVLHNPGERPVDVRIEISLSNGLSFADDVIRLEAGLTEKAEFGSQGPLQAGWARLSSEGGPFIASEFFELVQDGPRAGVLASAVTERALFFALNDEFAKTGFAVANPYSEDTEVTVQLLDPPGGEAKLPLPGRNHRAAFLTEPDLFPALGDYRGAVLLASAKPIIALALTQRLEMAEILSTVAVETPRGFFVAPNGNVGIGTTEPGERLQVQTGNILLQSDQEQDVRFERTAFSTQSFMNPIFSLGRIQNDAGAMDDSPNFRIRFYDGSPATIDPEDPEAEPGWPVLKLDSKGIVASVKPRFGPEMGRSSHFEGFIDGDREPLFRLNSFPEMQLEFGAGGDQLTDVIMRRDGDGELAFMNRPAPGEDLRERMRIASTGNVGIGTPSPAFSRLHVAGGIDQVIIEDNDAAADERLWLFTADSRFFNLRTANDDFTAFEDAISIERNGVTVVNVSYPTARLGIGTRRASAADLHVVGSALITEGIASSRQLKENISPLSQQAALEALMQFEPVRFTYKDDPDEDLQLGFISEDVPELASTPRRQGVQPMDLIAILTRVVQQQQKRIEALEQAAKSAKHSP